MPVLEVYINGTSMDINEHYQGLALDAAYKRRCEMGLTEHTISYIPGCAVRTPYIQDLGGIFSWNQERQINEFVEKELLPKLKETSEKKEKLTLKIYGLSRGGIGAFLLCKHKALTKFSTEELEIHLAAVDPVPGNLKITGWFDKFFGLNYTLANRSADLRKCKHLTQSLIFIGNEPFAIGHASLLPIMPKQCHSRVEIVSGSHADLEKSALVKIQLDAFYLSNASQPVLEKDKNMLLEAYQYLCDYQSSRTEVRGMHLGNEIITQIDPKRIYWNAHHQVLMGVPSNPDTCICRLKDPFSYSKSRFRMFGEGIKNTILLSIKASIFLVKFSIKTVLFIGALLGRLLTLPIKLLWNKWKKSTKNNVNTESVTVPKPPATVDPDFQLGGRFYRITERREKLEAIEYAFINPPKSAGRPIRS